MRKTIYCAAVAAGCVFLGSAAYAGNDCCWDWSPTETGVEDAGKGGPKDKEESIWAQCTNTSAATCWLRDGRQMIWVDWTCIQGGPSPDTETPPSNEDAGWYCVKKDETPPVLCPNGILDPGEACDPPADAACPGACRADCTCPNPQEKNQPPNDPPDGPEVGDWVEEPCGTMGCIAGCDDGACDSSCDDATADLPGEWIEETNFLDKQFLALVQAKSKINDFQKAVQENLAKIPNAKVVKIQNTQDAIAAIEQDFQDKETPINVVIFSHGAPGHIKLGEDPLEDPSNQAKFVVALKGKIKRLWLYGCSVAQEKGLQDKLSKELQAPVHAWTGVVAATGHQEGVPEEFRNKFYVMGDKKEVDIPTVSEWGLVVMSLLVLTAGTVVVMRRRRALELA